MGKDRSNGTDAAVHNGVKQQPNRQMSTELYDVSSKVQSLFINSRICRVSHACTNRQQTAYAVRK